MVSSLLANIFGSDIHCETWISQGNSRAVRKTNLRRRKGDDRNSSREILPCKLCERVLCTCKRTKCLYARNRRRWMYKVSRMECTIYIVRNRIVVMFVDAAIFREKIELNLSLSLDFNTFIFSFYRFFIKVIIILNVLCVQQLLYCTKLLNS